jgi:hypothetical protein
MQTSRTINVISNGQNKATTDGSRHKFLVAPGTFSAGPEPKPVSFVNRTGHVVKVTFPAAIGGAAETIAVDDTKSLELAAARDGEYEYTVVVHTNPPEPAHGDHSNPRIVYP